ncbi:MAG: hypothetical protein ACKV19_08820 [Verrucomicrobiales bacterium]
MNTILKLTRTLMLTVVVSATVVGCKPTPVAPIQQPARQHTVWEYKTVVHQSGTSLNAIEIRLNEAARDGWEVVGVGDGGTVGAWVLMRRATK